MLIDFHPADVYIGYAFQFKPNSVYIYLCLRSERKCHKCNENDSSHSIIEIEGKRRKVKGKRF